MDDGIVKGVFAVSKSEAEKAIVPLTSAPGAEVKKAVTAEGKTMTVTTKELARQLCTSKKVILENAKKCLPNKCIEHGKPTYWSEAEITVLLEFMKAHNNRTDLTVTTVVTDTSTSLTPALMIKQAMELAQKGYELEIERIKTERDCAIAENVNWQITFDEAKEWATIKRMETLNPGKKFPWRALRDFSLEYGYDIQKVYDKNYGEVNAYYSVVWEAVYGEQLDNTPWLREWEV